jgi:CHAT domain-containing protein
LIVIDLRAHRYNLGEAKKIMTISRRGLSGSSYRSFVFVVRYIVFATLLSGLLGLTAYGRPSGKSDPDPVPTKQEVHEIKDQEPPHSYTLRLKKNEFVQVRVEQYSVDVVLRLLDSSGRELAKIDTPNGTDGTETLSFVAEAPDTFRLEVGAFEDRQTGFYAIQGDPPRPAIARDFSRIKTERDFADASSLVNRDPDEQLLARLKDIKQRWQELNDEYLAQLTSSILEGLKQRLLERKTIEQLPAERKAAVHRGEELRKEIESSAVPKEQAGNSTFQKKTEAKLEQAFQAFKSADYLQGQVWCKFTMAELYGEDDDSSRALAEYKEALALIPAVKPASYYMRDYQARILRNMGKLYKSDSQQEQAFEAFSDGLKQYEQDELDETRASLFLNLAETLEKFDDFGKAEQSFLEARNIYLKLRMRGDEGVVLNKLGHLYSQQHSPQAFGTFQDADRLLKYSNIIDRYVWNLVALSGEYSALNDSENANHYAVQATEALEKWDAEVDPHVKIVTYLEVGDLFLRLGRNIDAKRNYKSGLDLADTHDVWVKDTVRYGFLKRLGDVALEMDNLTEGEEYLLKALKLAIGSKDKGLRTIGQMTMGRIFVRGNRVEDALKVFASAQRTAVDNNDLDGIAEAARELGKAYSMLGKAEDSWRNSEVALLHTGIFGEQRIAELSYDLMKNSARLGERRLAIFFGKQVISLIQKYRLTIRILDPVTQRAFLKANNDVYRELAILLIQEGRLYEARQIIQLYQDEAFFDALSTQKEEPASLFLTKTENKDLNEYNAIQSRIDSFRPQLRRSLLRKHSLAAKEKSVHTEQDVQAEQATSPFQTALSDFEKVIDGILADFTNVKGKPEGAKEITEEPGSRPALADLDKVGAAIIQTFAAKDSFYVLLVTRDGIQAFTTPITAVDLNNKAQTFLKLLATPPDPHRVLFPKQLQSAGTALHEVIFKSVSTADGSRTLESVLKKTGARVLFWALDSNLRSIPVAALYDSENRQYVLEQYDNVVFTRALPEHLSLESKPWTSRVCMGTLEEHAGGLSALPELRTTLQTFCGRNIVLNKDFTSNKMIQSLAARTPGSVVLIVSHFLLEPGDPKFSVLVMGSGTDYSLEEIRESPHLFEGVDLLILAACKTAVQGPSDYGAESEGFAELAQRLGANSVIGTLWEIWPQGTSELLLEFHRLHEQNPGWTKAKILRQAQLSLLHRRASGKKVDLSAPHYWAPFVLYGDFSSQPQAPL